jgi:hypothetical protein
LAVPAIAFLNNAVRVLLAKDPDNEQVMQQAQDGALVEAQPDAVDVESHTVNARPETGKRPINRVYALKPVPGAPGKDSK